ncbi:MAG: flagellar protein FlgN [Gammaproteobacteria bacterium]|nr:flagellar protein FlgN [Gammaproteobacteria bacterium]
MSAAAQSAKQLLDEQINILTQLSQLLRVEYDLLSTQKPDDLQSYGEQKQNMVNDLEVLNRSWQDFLRAQGCEFTLEGIRKCLVQMDTGATLGLESLWKTLSTLSKDCQQQNMINGAVIALRQQVTQQAMDILRGQSMGGSLYDNKGGHKPGDGSSGHTIAKA